MRYPYLILIVCTVFSSGCSALIARSGSSVSSLTTKDEVHERFGLPATSATVAGQPVESFHTRRKISEPLRSACLGMGIVMTFGLGEVIAFPHELYLLGRRTLFGQEIRFAYDSDGNVKHVYLEGEELSFLPISDHPDPVITARAQSLDQR